jgi:hypothetical protein
VEGIDRRVARAAGSRKAGVGRVGFLERPVPIDRQPGVERMVLALGSIEVALGKLARGRAAATKQRGHLVSSKARQRRHRCVSRPRGLAARR